MQFGVKRITTLLGVALASLSLAGCATSPTGRSQLLLYSDSQLSEMGTQAFTGMKSELTISDKPVENALVQCIAERLLQQVPAGVFSGEWEVVVFDDQQVNAFALPGGKIGVYTGLLSVASNQHQVAAVVGHEIGHVIAKHGNQRMSQSAVVGIGQQAVAQVLANNEVTKNNTIMQSLGMPIIGAGAQLGMLYYSRDHETEADIIGLDLMAKAGFKPSEAVQLWKNMAAQSSANKPPEFLSTHPAESTRIETLSANMPSANKVYEAALETANCQ